MSSGLWPSCARHHGPEGRGASAPAALPLGPGGDDPGQDLDRPVGLHHHAGGMAQGLVVLGGGREVDDHQRQAMQGTGQGDVFSKAIHGAAGKWSPLHLPGIG